MQFHQTIIGDPNSSTMPSSCQCLHYRVCKQLIFDMFRSTSIHRFDDTWQACCIFFLRLIVACSSVIYWAVIFLSFPKRSRNEQTLTHGLNSRFDMPRYISIYGALHFIEMHRHVFEVIFFSSSHRKMKRKKFLSNLWSDWIIMH